MNHLLIEEKGNKVMTYEEVLKNARNCVGDICKACPVCNGKACGGRIPGPGA